MRPAGKRARGAALVYLVINAKAIVAINMVVNAGSVAFADCTGHDRGCFSSALFRDDLAG